MTADWETLSIRLENAERNASASVGKSTNVVLHLEEIQAFIRALPQVRPIQIRTPTAAQAAEVDESISDLRSALQEEGYMPKRTRLAESPGEVDAGFHPDHLLPPPFGD